MRVALAGNANVGKSVIFNQLTGLHQHIGNWPGKTVEKAEGTLHFRGRTIDILDLPGIYSLSAFTLEERISREYIAIERPDVVINVVDASSLERNLFLTLQLLEMEAPVVVALNQIDMAQKKGIEINTRKLEELLGVPVVPTVAIRGEGLHRLLERTLESCGKRASFPKYGPELESKCARLEKLLDKIPGLKYPAKWVALKLLEGDEEIEKLVAERQPAIMQLVRRMRSELERAQGEQASIVVASERYGLASRIAREVQSFHPARETLSRKIERITTRSVPAYLILALVIVSLFYIVFQIGGKFAVVFDRLSSESEGLPLLPRSILGGLLAAASVALPYILPFYFLLNLLEDSGYLPRVAFLMDNLMHKIGVHGKAFIPAMLGFGCDVPACLGCRILETEREKILAALIVSMVPCAATSVIILGLVGRFLGIRIALLLYALDFCIILLIGRLLSRILPGEPMGMIMEMPPYRIPHLQTVLKQTWGRTVDFLKLAFPLIVLGNVVLATLFETGSMYTLSEALSPVTEKWLGLPAITGALLIMGILRKELILVLLATVLGTTNFSSVLNAQQMIVLGLVSMLYLPCISTYAAMVKEVGFKRATSFALFRIILAIFVGGIAFRILTLV